MSNQLAVLFPGIGYHIDKPLLYYSAKLARARGCDLLAVQYPALPTGLRGHTEKIEQAVQTALLPQRNSLPPSTGPLTTVFSSSRRASAPRLPHGMLFSTTFIRGRYTTRRLNRRCPISTRPASPFTHRRSVGEHRDDHERLPEDRHSALSDPKTPTTQWKPAIPCTIFLFCTILWMKPHTGWILRRNYRFPFTFPPSMINRLS